MFGSEPVNPSLNTTRKPLQQTPAAKPIIRVPEANPFTIINLNSYLQANKIPFGIAPGEITAAVISELMKGENKIEINCGKESGFARTLASEGTNLIAQRTGLSVNMEHLEDNFGNSYIVYTAERPIHRPTFAMNTIPHSVSKPYLDSDSAIEIFWSLLPPNTDPSDILGKSDKPNEIWEF